MSMIKSIEYDRFIDTVEEICDFYCKWPTECATQERLNMHCNDCPLNNLMNEDFWEERRRES